MLTADERRELRRLLDKMDGFSDIPAGTEGAMSDGSKRLREVSASSDQMPISRASMISKGALGTDKCYEDVVEGFDRDPAQLPLPRNSKKSVEGSGYVQGKMSGDDFSEEEQDDSFVMIPFPLPENVTKREWDQTICELPKVKNTSKWQGSTYAGLVALSESGKDLRSYLSWIKNSYVDRYESGHPKSQAIDLAGYLSHVGYSKKSGGFERKVAK